MADTSESADSRTSGVGRKRVLHDSSQHMVIDLVDSSGDEQPRKRARHESSGDSTVKGGVTATTFDSKMRSGDGTNVSNTTPLKNLQNSIILNDVSEKTQEEGMMLLEKAGSYQALMEKNAAAAPALNWNSSIQTSPKVSLVSKHDSNPRSNATLDRRFEESSEYDDEDEDEDEDEEVERDIDQNRSMMPFKKLDTNQLRKLSTGEKKAYHNAKRENDRIRSFEERVAFTAEVDEVLSRLGRWPLPETPECQKVFQLIKTGKTLYGRIPDGYNIKGHKKWLYPGVIVNERGMPIKAADFSFNSFAVAFLQSNSNRPDLTNEHVRMAFSAYVKHVFGHLPMELQNQIHTTKSATSNVQTARLKVSGSATHNDIPQADSSVREAQPVPLAPLSRENVPSQGKQDIIAPLPLSDGSHSPAHDSTDVGLHDQDEILLQQRYFPSATAEICIACAKSGHVASHCPTMSCERCGVNGEHSDDTCPQNKRCRKCQQSGHLAPQCPEKLALARSEMSGCDNCGSKEHLELECHYLWRSFFPSQQDIRTVRDIPVHCYTCGGDGHYGPECGLHRGVPKSGRVTWSLQNLHTYLDISSQNRALSAGIDYSIHPPKDKAKSISIKGRAGDDFIALDDSDDEPSFIRPKVNNTVRHGNIRVAQQGAPAPFPRRPDPPRDDPLRFTAQQGYMPYQSARPSFGEPSDFRRPGGNSFNPPSGPSRSGSSFNAPPGPSSGGSHYQPPGPAHSMRKPNPPGRGGKSGRGGRGGQNGNASRGGGGGGKVKSNGNQAQQQGQQPKKKKKKSRAAGNNGKN